MRVLVLCAFFIGCSENDSVPRVPSGPSECSAPVIPPPGDSIELIFAGAPVGLFGAEESPDFATVFSVLADAGVDGFFPFFGTNEVNGANAVTGHFDYFFHEDLWGPGVPRHCAVPGNNPYQAAVNRLGILVPAYFFSPDFTQVVDAASVRALHDGWLTDCLDGDESVLHGWNLHDEPATNHAVAAWEGSGAFDASLVGALDDALAPVSSAPRYIVEEALPLAIELNDGFGLSPTELATLRADFDEAVIDTAAHADVYGFDVYPVPELPDLTVVGEWVTNAANLAPEARLSATLQGFGFDDQEGNGQRRPTYAETRVMAYHALLSGARVLIWWGQSMMDISSDDSLWRALLATTAELDAMEPVFASPTDQVTVDGVPHFAGTSGDATWLILANPSNTSQVATISWGAGSTNARFWDAEATTWLESDDVGSVLLEPYDIVRLARVECPTH